MAEPSIEEIKGVLEGLKGQDLSGLEGLEGLGGLGGLGGFDISGIMSTVQSITSIVGRVFLILFSLWIGKKAFSGYKRPKNIIVSILGTLGCALLCLILGLIIGYGLFEGLGLKLGPMLEPMAEFIGVGITAAFIYLFLSVVFAPKKLAVVTRKEFEELKKTVDSLKDEVTQITKKLMQKKILPKAILLEEAIKKLKEALEEKKIKKYKIIKSKREGDNWEFKLKVKFKKYKAVISPTGALKEFEEEKIKILDVVFGVLKNKRFIVGIVLLIIFIYGTNSLWTIKAGIKLNEYVGIGPKCYKIGDLRLEIGTKSKNTGVVDAVVNKQSDFDTTNYTLREYEIEGYTYYLIEGYVGGETYSCSLLETEICECTELKQGGIGDLVGGLLGGLMG